MEGANQISAKFLLSPLVARVISVADEPPIVTVDKASVLSA
jgi:hypothetical protein